MVAALRSRPGFRLVKAHISSLTPLESVSKTLYIQLPALTQATQSKIRAMTCHFVGTTPMVLYDMAKKIAKGAPKEWSVNPSESLLRQLTDEFGEGNVILK